MEKTLGAKERKLVYAEGGSGRTRLLNATRRERASFVLADEEILQLARWAAAIERHYGRPMDIEWAKDADTGELAIVQARPETVQSRRSPTSLRTWRLTEKGTPLLSGASVGEAIIAGPVCLIRDAADIGRFRDGSVLVTEATDPDWVPIMKRAAAIVTDHGGATSHAAIISRELGLPAVVGTGRGTDVLRDRQEVTVSCAEGDEGHVYEGCLAFETAEVDLGGLPETRTAMMVNIASPAAAFRWWRLPTRGIGLARMEFIISSLIKIHPMALVRFDAVEDRDARRKIEALTRGYADKADYFVEGSPAGSPRSRRRSTRTQ